MPEETMPEETVQHIIENTIKMLVQVHFGT